MQVISLIHILAISLIKIITVKTVFKNPIVLMITFSSVIKRQNKINYERLNFDTLIAGIVHFDVYKRIEKY